MFTTSPPERLLMYVWSGHVDGQMDRGSRREATRWPSDGTQKKNIVANFFNIITYYYYILSRWQFMGLSPRPSCVLFVRARSHRFRSRLVFDATEYIIGIMIIIYCLQTYTNIRRWTEFLLDLWRHVCPCWWYYVNVISQIFFFS